MEKEKSTPYKSSDPTRSLENTSILTFWSLSIQKDDCPNKQANSSDSIRRHTSPLFLQTQQVDALGSLDGQTQGAVPDQLHQRAQRAADTEGHGVVQRLLEAVVVEEHARGGIDVRVGVLGLKKN